ncbi:hypothetical protein ABZ135_37365 [Streptomyces sp. NPDC006339]
MPECFLCGAPGAAYDGYCSLACEIADNPDDYPDYTHSADEEV